MTVRTGTTAGRVRWATFAATMIGALVAVQAWAIVPAPATSGNVEVEVQPPGSSGGEGTVASDGTNYLAAWTVKTPTGHQVRAARVSSTGAITGPVSVSDTSGNSDPHVAWNGSTYLVVWVHTYPSGDSDVFGRLINASGALAPSQFGVATLNTHETEPSVAAAGSRFYVAWTDDRNTNTDIYGTRISSSGSVLDVGGVRLTSALNAETKPAVAWNGTRLVVAYQFAFGSVDGDVFAQAVSASNVPTGAIVHVAETGKSEEAPTIASSGSGFLVAWTQTDADLNIDAQRLDANGAVTGASITVCDLSSGQSDPTVAFNGTYLVAWTDDRLDETRVYGARIGTNGTIQDTADGVDLSGSHSDGFDASVTKGAGSNWELAFHRGSSAGTTVDLRVIAPK